MLGYDMRSVFSLNPRSGNCAHMLSQFHQRALEGKITVKADKDI